MLPTIEQLESQIRDLRRGLGQARATQAAMRVERFSHSSGGSASETGKAVDAPQRECTRLRDTLAAHRLAAEPKQGDWDTWGEKRRP